MLGLLLSYWDFWVENSEVIIIIIIASCVCQFQTTIGNFMAILTFSYFLMVFAEDLADGHLFQPFDLGWKVTKAIYQFSLPAEPWFCNEYESHMDKQNMNE